ncbi:expressed unknown protein [Seminavis robusta]|uniref:Uncharacterized protein n=1 Tax=Seminavis robusta TaxID=568900 RepID=A0A9N8E794_9STRA|nr:expressed unknown protein [Seminavis robusta]|eukprot:Sro756_g197800.1 n/a (136) ;mRNA; r:30583-31279
MKYFALLLIACMMALAMAADDPRDLVKDRLNRKLSRNRYADEDDAATLKRIKEHDVRRQNRMRELIEQRTEQLKAHESGHRRLSDEEHTRFNRQIKAFKRKLEQVDAMSEEEYENSMQEMARSIKQMNTMGMPDL